MIPQKDLQRRNVKIMHKQIKWACLSSFNNFYINISCKTVAYGMFRCQNFSQPTTVYTKMITDLIDPNMGRPRSYKFVMRSGLPWCKMLKRAFVVVWDWGMFTRNGRWAMGKIYLLYGWVLTQCMTGCHLLHFNQRCRYGHCGPWQIALYLKSKHFVICEKLLFTLLCIKI